MLTYDESDILYGIGVYSLVTTSFKYGGLNENWARSKAPYSTHSEPPVKSQNPPIKPFKPSSTAILPTHPLDLDDEMALEDKQALLLLAKNVN